MATQLADQDLREEFEQNFMPFYEPIFWCALRLTRNRSDAEDLTQDTFEKAYRFFLSGRFKSKDKDFDWLYTIVRNSYINIYRYRKRRLTFLQQYPETLLESQSPIILGHPATHFD